MTAIVLARDAEVQRISSRQVFVIFQEICHRNDPVLSCQDGLDLVTMPTTRIIFHLNPTNSRLKIISFGENEYASMKYFP